MEGYRVLDKNEIIKAGDAVQVRNMGFYFFPSMPQADRFEYYNFPVYRKIQVQSEGYRYLDDGEVIKDGDDFRLRGAPELFASWMKTNEKGSIVGDDRRIDLIYRRPIDQEAKSQEAPTKEEPKTNVTQKYCYLKEGDVLQEGDEIYYHDDEDRGGYWHKSNIPGHVVSRHDAILCYCRRPIKEAKPEADMGYIYLEDGETIQEGDEVFLNYGWYLTVFEGAKVGGPRTKFQYRRKIKKCSVKEAANICDELADEILKNKNLKNKNLEEQLKDANGAIEIYKDAVIKLIEIYKDAVIKLNEKVELNKETINKHIKDLKDADNAIEVYKATIIKLNATAKLNHETIEKYKKELKTADDMLDECDETTDALNKDLDSALNENKKLKNESEQRLKTNLALTEDLNNLKHKLNQQDSFSNYRYQSAPIFNGYYYNPGKL